MFLARGRRGVPAYLFARTTIGNSVAAFLMIGIMLPFFFLAMFERDDQTAEKILRKGKPQTAQQSIPYGMRQLWQSGSTGRAMRAAASRHLKYPYRWGVWQKRRKNVNQN